MKTQINFLTICLMLAVLSLVPQVAHAQLVLTPPCTAASLSGGFGYAVGGYLGGNFYNTALQEGRLNFDGMGHFTNTYSNNTTQSNGNFLVTRGNVSAGTYTISSNCLTATLIFHGNPNPCVFYTASFNLVPPAVILLGTLTPGPPVSLLADATLACTDADATAIAPAKGIGFPGSGNILTSTFTGDMIKQ